MAELVGEAYIRVTADTTVMRRALAKQMKDAGKDDAGAYIRSFSKEVENTADTRMRGANKAFASALGDPKEFDRLAKNFDSIEVAANKWRKTLLDLNDQHKLAKGDLNVFTNAVNKWEKSAIAARDAQRELNKAHEEALVINRRESDHWKAARMDQEYNARALAKAAAARHKALGGDYRVFSRLYRSMDKFGDGFGRAFGKGSRNDFMNFVGSMVGGLAKMGTGIIQLPFKAFDNFRAGFLKAGVENASMLGKLGAGFTGMFGAAGPQGLIVGLAAVAAGMTALGAVLPGLVSMLGLMATAAVSLVSAISYGLVGALLAVGPAALGALAGLGGVFGAINTFANDKKNKEFWESIFNEPFKDMNTKHAGEVRTFLTGIRTGFITLFDDISPSITAFFASWKKHMTDPTTTTALGAWSDSLGRIATTFNEAIPALASGLVGFFKPILPYAEKLATAIADAFHTFDDWANSKAGQTAIGDFMKSAWEDAKLLWEILKDIGGIIGSVFDFGEPTGSSFLKGIHGWLEKIDTYLKDPANKGKIEEWFANAKDVGEDIGKIVTGVGDLIKGLSSEQGQKDAKDFMGTIGTLAENAERLADALNIVSATSGLGVLNSFFNDKPGEALTPGGITEEGINQWSADLNKSITEGLDTAWESTKTWVGNMGTTISTWATESVTSISTWATEMGTAISTWATDMGTEVSTFFTELPDRVSTWFSETITSLETGFQEGGTTILNGIAGWLEGLATGIESFDMSAFFAGILESVGLFFTGLGTQIVAGLVLSRESITTWVTTTWSDFTTWGLGVIQRLGDGLAAAPGIIATWAETTRLQIGGWVTSTIASFWAWAGSTALAFGSWMSSTIASIGTWITTTRLAIGGWVTSSLASFQTWATGMPARIQAGIATAGAYLAALPGRIAGWLAGVPHAITTPFSTAWTTVNGYFNGAAGRLASAASGVVSAIGGALSGVWSAITSPFSRALAEVRRLVSIIGSIRIPTPSMPDLNPFTAAGGIFNGAQTRVIAEAGPEAVVPLNRPLSMVDPAVRQLSAIAQGLSARPAPRDSGQGPRVTFAEGAIQVNLPTGDPKLAAEAVLDRLVSYIG